MRSKILSLSKSRFLGLLLVAILIAGAVLIFPVNNVTVPFAGKVITIGYSGSAGATVTLDYTVDGADDHVQIQAALDALPSTGGELVIIPLPATVNGGVYDFGAIVTRAINNVTISGTGNGTSFANNGATAIFSAGAQSGWIFKDFATDAGGVNVATATNTYRFNIWVNGALVNDFVDDSPANGVAAEGISSNWAYDHNAAATGVHGAGGNTILNTGDIDDTPNNGDTSDAISSNWAYDYSHTEPAITVYASNALNKPTGNLTGVYYLCDGTADNVEINAAIDALSAGRTWKEQVKLIGRFYLQAPISMPDWTILDLYDAELMAYDGANYLAGPFIRNDDWTTNGNAACEIWGGTLIGAAGQSKGTWDDTTPAAIACAIEWFQPSAGVPAPITALGDIVPSLKVKDLLAINMKAGGIYYRGHGGDSGAIYIYNCQLYGLGGSDYTVYLYDVVDSKVESSGGWMTAGGLRLITCQAGMFADNYWGGGDNGIYMTGTSRWNTFVSQRLDNCAQHFLLIGTYGTAAPHYNSFYNTHFRFLTAAPNNTYDCINITGGSVLNAAYNLFDGITYVKGSTNDARYIVNETGTAAYVHNNIYTNLNGDAPETGVLATVQTTYNPFQNIKSYQGYEAHTGNDTLTVDESKTIHSNLGASGNITMTLPAPTLAGIQLEFVVQAAYELRIDPGASDGIYINGALQTDGHYIWADDEGESVKLVSDGTNWVAMYATGTWGVE